MTTLPVPGFRQARGYSCGYASALMVLRYFRVDVPGEELFSQLGTDRTGTRQSALVRTLRNHDVRVSLRYDSDFDGIVRAIDQNKLIIAYLADAEHWLVLYGYGRRPERVFVADPRPGQTCEQDWREYGKRLQGFAMVCSRGRVRETREPRVERGQLSFEFADGTA